MKNKSSFYIFSLLALFIFGFSYGQIPVINTPQPSNMPTVPSYTPINSNPNIPNNPSYNQNRRSDIYEQDRRSIQQRDAELNEMLNQYAASNRSIQYDLPTQADKQGAENYRKASKILNSMLNGETPLNLKDAVFTVENAFFGGKLEYPKYNKAIQNMIAIAKLKAIQDGYDWKNPMTRNVMLFRVMADTLTVKVPSKEAPITSYPVKYDFDDYEGKDDWSKMFVSKLLSTKTGQCHSMPLLYLIMCEATNTEANLAFAPSHSYAKFKDPTGNWYNLELTNGSIVTDAFVMGSGFITAEALKNKIYMEPQTKKQTIEECLGDLAFGYANKYGYDGFVDQCIDTVLKHNTNNLQAIQLKANYQGERFKYVVHQVGRIHPDSLKVHYPHVYQLLEERNRTYKKIDESGYREMPEEAYRDWLNSIKKEKEKQENEKLHRILQITK